MEKKKQLEERLKKFSINVLRFVRNLPKTEENKIFLKQIVRSSNSIGANYAESTYAQSRQEFIHCLKIARKEANETLYWLDIISRANPINNINLQELVDENKQILRILISSIKTLMLDK